MNAKTKAIAAFVAMAVGGAETYDYIIHVEPLYGHRIYAAHDVQPSHLEHLLHSPSSTNVTGLNLSQGFYVIDPIQLADQGLFMLIPPQPRMKERPAPVQQWRPRTPPAGRVAKG